MSNDMSKHSDAIEQGEEHLETFAAPTESRNLFRPSRTDIVPSTMLGAYELVAKKVGKALRRGSARFFNFSDSPATDGHTAYDMTSQLAARLTRGARESFGLERKTLGYCKSLLRKADWAQAEIVLRQRLEQEPDDVRTGALLVSCLARMGRIDEATDYADTIASRDAVDAATALQQLLVLSSSATELNGSDGTDAGSGLDEVVRKRPDESFKLVRRLVRRHRILSKKIRGRAWDIPEMDRFGADMGSHLDRELAELSDFCERLLWILLHNGRKSAKAAAVQMVRFAIAGEDVRLLADLKAFCQAQNLSPRMDGVNELFTLVDWIQSGRALPENKPAALETTATGVPFPLWVSRAGGRFDVVDGPSTHSYPINVFTANTAERIETLVTFKGSSFGMDTACVNYGASFPINDEGECPEEELAYLRSGRWGFTRIQNYAALPKGDYQEVEVGPALSLCNFYRFRQPYYHGLLQYLPAFFLFRQHYPELRDLPLLVPADMSNWQRTLLKMGGFEPQRFIEVGENQVVRASSLYLPEARHQLREIEPAEVNAFRSAIRGAVSPSSDSPRFIYVSRRHQLNRILANELEIEDVARRNGLAVIMPETLSIQEQATLFAGCRLIAGPSGAALANMVFADAGAEVICLTPRRRARTAFVSPAAALGHGFTFVLGDSICDDGIFGDEEFSPYIVAPEAFEAAIIAARARLAS